MTSIDLVLLKWCFGLNLNKIASDFSFINDPLLPLRIYVSRSA